MYIALKWLLILNFVLWLALCINNILQGKNKDKTKATDFYCSINSINEDSRCLWLMEEINVFAIIMIYTLQIILFGMIVLVSLCKNQNWIYWQSKLKLTYGYIVSVLKYAYYIYYTLWYYLKSNYQFKQLCQSSKELQSKYNVANVTLFYLIIKYLMKERMKLVKAVSHFKQHNKNAKTHYKLEILANKRQPNIYIEDTQKQDLSYKQSYIKLCCENTFLRSSLEKLAKEKKTIERNILNIITQVFLTNNNDLKAYCSKFVVRTKDVLLKADMELEVQRFLTESGRQPYHPKLSKENTSNGTHSNYPNNIRLLDALHSRCKDEYIWAVKDQDGQIVKLYDLDSESTGNVRKIIKYVVYYKMDSLIDHNRILSGRGWVADLQKQVLTLPMLPTQQTLSSLLMSQGFLQNFQDSHYPAVTPSV